jgi:uncharacterized lipoprotein YmbA
MKALSSLIVLVVLTGCSSLNQNYQVYVDTQKTLNKDYTTAELARIAALTEIVKSTDDVQVRIQAIRALQEIQRSKRPLPIEPPKNRWGF